ncbi:hypothetical protein TNCV_782761 [Trichonephila clavipes]|nr:hypothetical protein TNCV_782761 [Trichonephila clavipes]
MATGSRCMRGNTCGGRMSWAYRWDVMVPRVQAMSLHNITPAVGAVCHCKAKAGLRRSQRNQFLREQHHCKCRCRWVGVKASHVMGALNPNALQPGICVWFDKTQGLLRFSRRLVCQGCLEPGLRVTSPDLLIPTPPHNTIKAA